MIDEEQKTNDRERSEKKDEDENEDQENEDGDEDEEQKKEEETNKWEQMKKEEEEGIDEEEVDEEDKEDEEEKGEEGDASISVSLTEADMEVLELLAKPERRGFCPIREESVAPSGKAWLCPGGSQPEPSPAAAAEQRQQHLRLSDGGALFSAHPGAADQCLGPCQAHFLACWLHPGILQASLDGGTRKPNLDECHRQRLVGGEKGQRSRRVSLTPPPVPPQPPRPARPMSIGSWIQQDYERASQFQDVNQSSSSAPLHADRPCMKDAIFDLSDDEEPVYALDQGRKDLGQDGPRQEFIEKLERLESSRAVEDTGHTERFFSGELEGVVSYSVHVDTLPLSTQEAATQIRASDRERRTTRDRPLSPVPTLGVAGLRSSRMLQGTSKDEPRRRGRPPPIVSRNRGRTQPIRGSGAPSQPIRP
ncbi:X-linked retinitis pigmentosa GTPase regulator-interacting protein 1-like [Scylla paramamosain]|uniref:X-linked retinitis pigmentosa GTPase regulator-interacting protein 1-like n=1 Tax=Scylla paramamosain TaxID=85552 RepID=UPI00308365D1